MAKKGKDGKELRGPRVKEVSTKQRLAEALYELLKPSGFGLDEFIERARSGFYEDYESPLATPLVQLAADIRAYAEVEAAQGREIAGVGDFVARIVNGEFDSTKAESQAWMEREGKYILQDAADRGSVGEDGSKGREESKMGAADTTNATYLTRRLFQLFEALIHDEDVQYSNADMMMGIHNAHVWCLLEMLKQDSLKEPELRNMVLRSALDTFRMRIERETSRG